MAGGRSGSEVVCCSLKAEGGVGGEFFCKGWTPDHKKWLRWGMAWIGAECLGEKEGAKMDVRKQRKLEVL